jgi:hypothetical protein
LRGRVGLQKTDSYVPFVGRNGWIIALILCIGLLSLGAVKAVSQRRELRDLELRVKQEEQFLAVKMTVGRQVGELKEEVKELEAKVADLAVMFPKDEEVPALLSWLKYWLKNSDAVLTDVRHSNLERLNYYTRTQITLDYTSDFETAVRIAHDLFTLFPSVRVTSGYLGVYDNPGEVKTRLNVYLYSIPNKDLDWRFPAEKPLDLYMRDIFAPDEQLALKLSLGKVEERLVDGKIRLVGVIMDENKKYALVDVNGKTQLITKGQDFHDLIVQMIGPDYVALGLSEKGPFVFIRGNSTK